MKVGLLGYGKMGKAIEGLAAQQGFEIAWIIDQENRGDRTTEKLREADVVIEFTRPDAAFDNVCACLRASVPVVSGTTGWLDKLPEAQALCREHNGAFIWASNFSIGVNLLFAVNRQLAHFMQQHAEYEPTVTEIHHIHKLDAPSGTALTLTNDILSAIDRKSAWVLQPAPAGPADIPVTAIREGETPGTHIVSWESAIDEIKIEHKAHSRTGFASGAVYAAKWLIGKKGCFTMQDVLGL